MGEELCSVAQETELKPVVKAGWEDVHKILTDKLQNLVTDIDTKVNEYREQLLSEVKDETIILESMIADCIKYVEVPKEEPVETEETEENNYIGE